MKKEVKDYIVLFISVFLLDRLSKVGAMYYCTSSRTLLPGVTCELLFNRGISWGMFQARSWLSWFLLSLGLAFIIVALGVHAYERYKAGKFLFGEILILAGAISNLIDRIWYGAVIDFLSIGIGQWQFPTLFNVADVAIVGGALIMLFSTHFEDA